MILQRDIIAAIERAPLLWHQEHARHIIICYARLEPMGIHDDDGTPFFLMNDPIHVRRVAGVWQMTQLPGVGWWEIPDLSWFIEELERHLSQPPRRMRAQAMARSRHHPTRHLSI